MHLHVLDFMSCRHLRRALLSCPTYWLTKVLMPVLRARSRRQGTGYRQLQVRRWLFIEVYGRSYRKRSRRYVVSSLYAML